MSRIDWLKSEKLSIFLFSWWGDVSSPILPLLSIRPYNPLPRIKNRTPPVLASTALGAATVDALAVNRNLSDGRAQ